MMERQYIELLGEKHPLCFSMSAAQRLTERFGSLDEMGAQLGSEDASIRRDAINDALEELMQAGRVYAKALGEPLPPQLPCKPADVLPPQTAPVLALILRTMRGDSQRDVEAEGSVKNVEATPGD